MAPLTDYTSYADAQRDFASARLWDLFDGDRERLNIAHECIDRHATDPHRIAIRIAHADGRDEAISFRTIAEQSSRYAHWLAEQGIARGDRVAIMLEPSLAFYAALFGTMKLGAIAVPLFTLFGPDGVRSRVDDCTPRLLLTTPDKAQSLGDTDATRRRAGRGLRHDHARAIRPASRRRRAATIWRSTSIRLARRAKCRQRSVTRIAPSSW